MVESYERRRMKPSPDGNHITINREQGEDEWPTAR
jgi:hypothetical protein